MTKLDELISSAVYSGRLVEAIDLLQTMILGGSQLWEYYFWLAKIAERGGALPEAERLFQNAMKLCPPGTTAPNDELALMLERQRLLPLDYRSPPGWGRMLNVEPTTRCNQRCLFCNERSSHFSRPDVSLDWLRGILDYARNWDYTAINFLGGEVTLWQPLVPGVRLAHAAGLRVAITTNGVRLGSEPFLRELVDAGLEMVSINFPSHVPEDDRRICGQEGGHRHRCEALRNIEVLRREGANTLLVSLVIVLNSLNVQYLDEMVRFLEQFPVDQIFFLRLEITSSITDVAIVPRYSSFRDELNKTMKTLSRDGVLFQYEGLPLCIVDPEFHSNSKLNLERTSIGFDPQGRLLYLPMPNYPVRHPLACCSGCSLSCRCCQPQKEYVDIFGDKEFIAQRATTARLA